MGLLEMLVDSELVQIMGIAASIKGDRQGNGARGTTSCSAHQLNLVYSCGRKRSETWALSLFTGKTRSRANWVSVIVILVLKALEAIMMSALRRRY